MKTEIKTEDWPNGKRKYEIPCVNGQLHGLAKWWYENGQKEVEIPYINGQIHGLAKSWHKNGQRKREAPYVNGQRHGVVKRWRYSGSLKYSGKWHQGQQVWKIGFPSEEKIQGNTEIELFFHLSAEYLKVKR